MNTPENRLRIERALGDVANLCRQHRGLVLTESDLKCQLYMRLNADEFFGRFQETFDPGVNSISIHTETKFFNRHGLLSKAPDLVVTDPGRLSLVRRLDGELLPSKGFHFDGSAVLIELKFLRSNRRPSAKDLRLVEQDIRKGQELNARGNLDFHLFVAVYDRFQSARPYIEEVFHRFNGQLNLTCRYFAGGDRF